MGSLRLAGRRSSKAVHWDTPENSVTPTRVCAQDIVNCKRAVAMTQKLLAMWADWDFFLNVAVIHYLEFTQRDVLLNSKFNHIEHVKVKQTTCRQTKGTMTRIIIILLFSSNWSFDVHLKWWAIDQKENLPNTRLWGLFLLWEPNRNREQSDFLEKNSWLRVMIRKKEKTG